MYEGEFFERARRFRRWIAEGAEPGALRALAGEHADESRPAPPPQPKEQPPSTGPLHADERRR